VSFSSCSPRRMSKARVGHARREAVEAEAVAGVVGAGVRGRTGRAPGPGGGAPNSWTGSRADRHGRACPVARVGQARRAARFRQAARLLLCNIGDAPRQGRGRPRSTGPCSPSAPRDVPWPARSSAP
jgi:hypothetical protein